MAQDSKIEWTEQTWNPVTGCSKVSPGCKNCYAETVANRFWKDRKFTDVQFHDDRLEQPLKRKKPTMYFVNSMSDLFHESLHFNFIDDIFAVMALARRHTFQVLTKRIERAAEYMTYKQRETAISDSAKISWSDEYDVPRAFKWPLPNVWLGTSVENQEQADKRIPHLLKVPAKVRFLSCEPLLGPIHNLPLTHRKCTGCGKGEYLGWNIYGKGLDMSTTYCKFCGCIMNGPEIGWVIIGGESGPNARECNIEWIRDLVQQCRAASVPVFVKQLGACPTYTTWEGKPSVPVERPWTYRDPRADRCVGPDRPITRAGFADKKGGDMSEWPEDLRVREFPR